MDAESLARTEREIAELRGRVEAAQRTADGAVSMVSSHEQLCTLRYDTINAKLADVPRIYEAIGELQKIANQSLGAWRAVMGLSVLLSIASLLLGVVYTIYRLLHGV